MSNGCSIKDCTGNGLYYYGARYYDPRTSVWLSTDPLQEKYSSISTYAYAFLNPVKYVDPNGMEGKQDPSKGGVRIVLNLGGGSDIHDSAETRKAEIEKQYPKDKLIYINDNNLGNLKKQVEEGIEKAQKRLWQNL